MDELPAELRELDWLRGAIEAAGDLVYDWDLASGRMQWTGALDGFFRDGDADPVGTAEAFAARINPEDVPGRLKALSDHLGRSVAFDCEYRLRAADGEFQWVHDRGSVLRRPDGGEYRMLGSLRRIAQRKQTESRLERLASFDDLTGHFNLPRLRDALEHALTLSGRYGVGGAYLAVGVDKLALVNGTFGYDSGDAVLVGIGRRLERVVRGSDIIGRVGADRFGVILSQCSAEQLPAAAERILQAVRAQPIDTPQAPIHATISIGATLFPGDAAVAYDLMTKAETALKDAKRDGRDCFAAYRPSERQTLLLRRGFEIATQVQQAIKDERLILAYQPIVRASDQATDCYECLVRMRDENGDLVPAAAFVPVIEQLGLVRTVDRYVLELAIRELTSDPAVRLAVNISGLTASDRSWLRTLIGHLRGRPDLADRLVIEITETAALHDIEESARFVAALRDLGCRVALDDFGAGFTSFRHLRALAIDIVKIDGSFVRNLTESVDNQLFIRNLLGLANAFNLATVAECIEGPDEAAFLVGEGVQYLQGYYFGRPVLDRVWQKETAAPRLRLAQ